LHGFTRESQDFKPWYGGPCYAGVRERIIVSCEHGVNKFDEKRRQQRQYEQRGQPDAKKERQTKTRSWVNAAVFVQFSLFGYR
jgi:hypothetical protein